MAKLSALIHITLVLVAAAVSGPLFQKPQGFHEDDSHNKFFIRIDKNRDGLISRSELLSNIDITDAVFDYLLSRRASTRNPDSEYRAPMLAGDALTYSEFMWFYRESTLFENHKSEPLCAPPHIHSFPSWPGMITIPSAEEMGSMSPKHFWSTYVVPHKAVVIRNALNGSTALARWSDPDYLISQFGGLEAKIEPKLEARGDSADPKPTSSGRARIVDILNGSVDGYVVSVVPQPMAWDVLVPSCVLCGQRSDRPYLSLSPSFPFMTELEETSLWISRGKTRSQFHYDKENTFNCLVTGEPKQWVLLDTRKYSGVVPWARGGGYNASNDLFNRYTDWVGVDVDNLDLNLHNYLVEAEFEILTQYPGDCVFLPYSMLHYAGHLTADPSTLQVAVSFMWLPEVEFSNLDFCDAITPPLPLAVFDTVWYYSGYGAIPQGHHDPRNLKRVIIKPDGKFNPAGVLSFLAPGVKTGDEGFSDILTVMELIRDLVKAKVEVPLDVWLQLSTAVDMNGLGCNRGMEYIPRPFEEMNRMLAYLEHWQASLI